MLQSTCDNAILLYSFSLADFREEKSSLKWILLLIEQENKTRLDSVLPKLPSNPFHRIFTMETGPQQAFYNDPNVLYISLPPLWWWQLFPRQRSSWGGNISLTVGIVAPVVTWPKLSFILTDHLRAPL